LLYYYNEQLRLEMALENRQNCLTRGFHRCVTQRTAFRRHAAVTCGLAEKHSTVLIARGTPAARRWLPQALASYRLSVERKTLAVRNDGSHA